MFQNSVDDTKTTLPPPDVCANFQCPDDGYYPEGACSEYYCNCANGIPYEQVIRCGICN